jgi:tetratricopeptide (TPR) repeat protein
MTRETPTSGALPRQQGPGDERRAVNLLEKQPGTEYALAAWACRALAGIELTRGAWEEAERSLEKAASLLTYAYPNGERFLEAELLFRRAQLRLKQGRGQEGREDFARAFELLTELGGEEHERKKVMQAQRERLGLNL